MNRPSMPPEVQEAYDRGEVVTWSPVRGAWVVPGKARTEVVAQTRRGRSGADVRQDVAAALEELAPRPVAVPKRREVPDRCPRCGGTIVRSVEPFTGDRDDYCLACAWRVGELTREEAEARRRMFEGTRMGKHQGAWL